MRVYKDYNFIAKSLSGNGDLVLAPNVKTISDVRKGIDCENKRAISNGWHPQQFYICRVTYRRVFDDNDHFVSDERSIRRIELYPPTLS